MLAEDNRGQRSQRLLAAQNAGVQCYAGTDNLLIDSLADSSNALSEEWDREHGRHALRRLQELVEPEFTPTS